MPETTQSETDVVETNDVLVEDTRKIPNLSTLDDLRDLSAGSQIEVTRLTPSPIKGFCGNLIVPDGGMTDVLEEIQATYGGGKYQLRGKCTIPNGRLVYAQGAVQVDVAGYPTFQGKEYVNGIWRNSALPAAAAQVMPMQNPGRQTAGQGLESMLGGLVQTALQGAINSPNGVNMGELPALITSIAALSSGGERRDSFGEMERALSLLAKMQESRPEPAPAPASDDMGGLSSILPMIMQRFAATPQPPAPQYQPPPPPPPAYQQYGAVPSEQMWGNMQQRPPAGPHPHPQYAQPPNQPNWTNAPQSAHASSAPASPPQAPQSPPGPQRPPETTWTAMNGSTQTRPDDPPGEEYDPLTVDDVMQDLASRDEPGRVQFLGELCTSLGIDEAMVKTMFPDGAPDSAAMPNGFALKLPGQ